MDEQGVVNAAVSVVIPCYKCADTIMRAVNSVWTQTLRPYEVVLVEDCSPDDGQTLQALYNLKLNYPPEWVKIIPLPINHGPAHARNIGWEASSQQYIGFLDADDSWHSQKIAIQYSWMMQHPEVDLTAHRCMRLKKEVDNSSVGKWSACSLSLWELLLSNKISTRSVMLRRDINCKFNPSKRYSEDYLLWLEIIANGYSCWLLKVQLAYLYKAPYGEGGLSGDLSAMEKGELDTYKKLREQRLLGRISCWLLMTYSFLKYLFRLVRSRL